MSSEVSGGWRTYRLDELAKIKRGASPRPIQDPRWFAASGHGWVRISDVTRSDRVLRSTTQYLSDEGRAASVEIQPGDLIMSICATIGRPLLSGIEACIHDGFVAFKDIRSDVIDPAYLYQFLKLSESHFDSLSQPGTQKNLNSKLVGGTEISLPPLTEQQRIAEILLSVEEATKNAQICLNNARSVMSALLDHHFITNADVEGSSSALLSTLIDLQSGYAFKSDDYQESGHFLIRIGNVQDGYISDENPKFVELDAKSKGFELHAGDILTSLTGNIGRVARVESAHLPAALNQRVARIKPKPNVAIDADYLFFALKSPLFKAALSRASGGAAQQNVSPKAIASIAIPLPSIEHQSLIGAALLSVDKFTFAADDALKRLENLKSVVRSDLLSGRVRVPA